APARELHGRGVTGDDPLGARAYGLLGQKYQVAYAVEDRLALGLDRLTFLLNDLPLAAKLLTRFQGVDYKAEYLDPAHRRFRGAAEPGIEPDHESQLVQGHRLPDAPDRALRRDRGGRKAGTRGDRQPLARRWLVSRGDREAGGAAPLALERTCRLRAAAGRLA